MATRTVRDRTQSDGVPADPTHPPHPEVRRSRLEGTLQGSRGWLEGSFEASLRPGTSG
ncbi:hypothetical protein ACLBX9_26210 [Methylobacterium sp. A49B]